MSNDLTFKTAISGEHQGKLYLRGTPIKKLIAEADFVSSLFLSITGKQPSEDEKVLLNAVLVAALDPGLEPATGFTPRVAVSSGAEITTAIATSILVLGPRHGAAVTAAMQLFEEVGSASTDIERAAQRVVAEYRKLGNRIPGFGHPKGKQSDERAQALFAMARRSRIPLRALDAALCVETALEEHTGRKLPLNIDGAVAALLVAMGLDSRTGNAMYAVARAAGSIAHCVEELEQNNGVRRLRAEQVEFNHV